MFIAENSTAIFAVIKALEAQQVTPEEARISLMIEYHRTWGSWLRELSEQNPGLARTVVVTIVNELSHVAQEQPHAKTNVPRRIVFKHKELRVLQREIAILVHLMKSNVQTLPEVMSAVRHADSQVNRIQLTSHLDRLARDGFVDRPRRGYYKAAPQARKHLDALKKELSIRS